jgi:hypothetical protein
MRRLVLIALLGVATLVAVPQAEARKSAKKGIWGPVSVDGVSQFPIYRDLGAGIYHASFSWSSVARWRPANPTDPSDPAYQWPASIDQAVAEAKQYGLRVALMVKGTPAWANGGRPQNWAPSRPGDYADFMAAAASRYRSVRYWVVWGEPTRQPNFMPLPITPASKPLTRSQRAAPHRYARILDAAYGAIKRVNRRALVVGGNTFTNGHIGPRNWIANLELPSGRPPRMDLYGHNPFAARRPDLSKPPLVRGYADFCDLDDVARWVDRYLGRTPRGARIKLWLGEYTAPTQPNSGFGWHVSPATQASWLRSALRITRRWKRIEALNWLTLYDERPSPEARWYSSFGLLDADGTRKPSFAAFQRG